jgi:hypothetical protein
MRQISPRYHTVASFDSSRRGAVPPIADEYLHRSETTRCAIYNSCSAANSPLPKSPPRHLIRKLCVLERDLDIAARPARSEHEVDRTAKLARDEIAN